MQINFLFIFSTIIFKDKSQMGICGMIVNIAVLYLTQQQLVACITMLGVTLRRKQQLERVLNVRLRVHNECGVFLSV